MPGKFKEPVAKSSAGVLLLRHWRETRGSLDFHRARPKGDVEALLCRVKMQWLAGLIREVEALASEEGKRQ